MLRSNVITIFLVVVLLPVAFLLTQVDKNSPDISNKATSEIVQPPSEFEILTNEGCIDCHSVKLYGIKSFNNTGPDLTNVQNNVQKKYKITINEFIENPPSNVMTNVIRGKKYTEETRNKIVESLYLISEK